MEISTLPLDVPADHPRAVLHRLVAERGGDYSALSRMIGRNPAYIQQFIKRGTPRRLSERDRALLASYFVVDEQSLGAPNRDAASNGPVARDGLLQVPRLDIGASAGGGTLADDERAEALFAFDPRWLRRLSASPKHLSIIRVEGDSMLPTLSHGDDIMVDAGDAMNRLRDGIYVLRRDGVLLVKRLACGGARADAAISIISDNAAYPTVSGVERADLHIVGRVVWTGRRIS